MFIRRSKKQRSKDAKIYYQYTLAQSVRVNGKVKQRGILYLGSDALLEDKSNRSIVVSMLKARIFGQEELFPEDPPEDLKKLALFYYEKYLIKYGVDHQSSPASIPPAPARAEFHNIDIKGMELEDVKTFGGEHLCVQILEKLQLSSCLRSLGMSEELCRKALISIASRALFSSSGHKTAQILEMNSELVHCLRHTQKITHKQLYAISDMLYEHKEHIDAFLYQRLTDMFEMQDKLFIFDISNTYFETGKRGSHLARYARSKEKRNDCPLVVFTGVINEQGFIKHSRIYEGNKADVSTLADMLSDLEKHACTRTEHTVVIDAGIADEKNLELITSKGYKYVCVSRKRLKEYPINDQSIKISQLTDRNKNKVVLAIFKPEGYSDTWMYVQSEAKRNKEQAMASKLEDRYIEDLKSIQKALTTKGGTKRIDKVWERIGRKKQKNSRISAQYDIRVTEKDGLATYMWWTKKKGQITKDKSTGVYFIRTNYENPNEKQLWNIYNTIREVESTFRCLKTDLHIRPVHHQLDHRIEAHIYLTILAYQLVHTIRHMLKQNGINYDWKNILRIMNTQTIQTIVLPTDKKVIHLRKPSKPIHEVQQIYQATKCTRTQMAVKKYVVYH